MFQDRLIGGVARKVAYVDHEEKTPFAIIEVRSVNCTNKQREVTKGNDVNSRIIYGTRWKKTRKSNNGQWEIPKQLPVYGQQVTIPCDWQTILMRHDVRDSIPGIPPSVQKNGFVGKFVVSWERNSKTFSDRYN